MLAGPMDVTPGAFRNVTEAQFFSQGTEAMAIGTRCSQLAMFIIYESPLQSVCDYPDAYRGQKGSEFLKSVPASWDETKVLVGEIGEYIIIARRKGENWFIGGMTNENSRKVSVPLNFLKGNYSVIIYKDGANANNEPTSIEIENSRVNPTDQLTMEMSKGGGFVIQLNPLK
jgi:alpha-glucosidase